MSTIIDFNEKGKGFLERVSPFYNLLLLFVVASIFFALGRLSAMEDRHAPIKIENSLDQQANLVETESGAVTESVQSAASQSGEVIGSKSGKKYYFPWCGTVSRIKSENQVHFASIELAKAAGFTPGGNCKGLK